MKEFLLQRGWYPLIHWKVAEPKTCWWSNTRHRKGKNVSRRQDTIVAINRTYRREDGKYIYSLTVGRFKIGIMF